MEELEDLRVRYGKLNVKHNVLLLQTKTPLGRAPTMEEFEQLTTPLQTWWARKYPEELQQYLHSRDERGKFFCDYVFADGVKCGKSYVKKAAAKQCRQLCRIEAINWARANRGAAEEHPANRGVSE